MQTEYCVKMTQTAIYLLFMKMFHVFELHWIAHHMNIKFWKCCKIVFALNAKSYFVIHQFYVISGFALRMNWENHALAFVWPIFPQYTGVTFAKNYERQPNDKRG